MDLKWKIIISDDSPDFCAECTAALKPYHFMTETCACQAGQLMELIKEYQPHAVLLNPFMAQLDAIAVCGNCASREVLLQAGLENAELLIAATNADEVNLLCCMTAHGINLIALPRIDSPIRVEARIRYSALPAPATVEQTDEDTLRLRFDEPQRAITPGQSVVLYDGETVIGGGIISAEKKGKKLRSY